MESKDKEEVKVRIKVVQPFRDRFDKSIRYEAGRELEFEAARAEDVVTRGLAEYTDPIG